MANIKIGWAKTSITPDRPVYNGGQIYPRVSKYVHDPLTATALALDNGEACAIMISADMTDIPEATITSRVRANLADLEGFSPEHLTISATHTHNSMYAKPLIYDSAALDTLGEDLIEMPETPDDILCGIELEDFIVSRMTRVAREAWTARKPGGVSTASDYAAVAFNRRPVFEKDGVSETQMYGVCARDDFAHYEAGSDHSIDMIYTWDEARTLTGILVCVPCPSQVFELHSFITADYWHYTREAIREALGNVYVLPLCGAAGDQNPLDLTRISKHNRHELEAWGAQAGEVFRNFDMADICRGIADRITEAVKRGMRISRASTETQPIFKHIYTSLTLPIRKVAKEDYDIAMETILREKARFSPENRMQGADMVRVFEPLGVIGRYIQQNECDTVKCAMHCLRIGNMALVTCPFELFIEYSLRIKARAASLETAVVQLTDQSFGYVPSRIALAGGSYSSAPASTTCGPDGGDALVEEALTNIAKLWGEPKDKSTHA